MSSEAERETFFLPPTPFTKEADRDILAYAVGAVLYMPATRPNFADELARGKYLGLVSVTLCLEDAIGDHQVSDAEKHLVDQIFRLAKLREDGVFEPANLPLIFIRVRAPEQMLRIITQLKENIELVSGFVWPKFSPDNGPVYLAELRKYNDGARVPLYGMPILESPEVIFAESRLQVLQEIKVLLNQYQDLILNVRIGATDFSGLYGIRRGADVTIYDIAVIRDCIADIVNVFRRVESSYVLSGPVWEYFSGGDRIFKPQLRESPFSSLMGGSGREVRRRLLDEYLDGLIREVILDRENGLIGKTIIHPSHIIPVQALYVVSREEYADAMTILAGGEGGLGVVGSQYTNKMNEIKPHWSWAQGIRLRARVYGVFHEQSNFINLLTPDSPV